MFNYSTEEMWELYRSLPKDLKEISFSEKSADRISAACQSQKLDKEKEKQVIKMVGYVLFGLLPPREFAGALEKELKIEKETAEKIFTEINAFIFSQVKGSLNSLYDTKTEEKEEKKEVEKNPYREPID